MTSGPFHQLTPFQTHLLSALAEQLAQLPTTSGPAASTRVATASGSGEDARRRRTTSSSLGGTLLASGLMGEVLLGMEVAVQPYVEGAVQVWGTLGQPCLRLHENDSIMSAALSGCMYLRSAYPFGHGHGMGIRLLCCLRYTGRRYSS